MTSFTALRSLTIVAACAVLAPFLAESLKRFRVPSIVVELLLGILIGPQLLHWADTDILTTLISEMGLVFLMFIAGFEVNLAEIKGRPILTATAGWVGSALLATAVVFGLFSVDLVDHRMVVGLALTTTALTSLVPILRDAEVLKTPFGTDVMAVGTVGEFLPLVGVGLLLASSDTARRSLLLIGFVVIAITAAFLATLPKPPRLLAFLRRQFETSSQLPVRIAILLILSLMLLADSLSIDLLLGSFTAGVVMRLLSPEVDRPALEVRLSAIGFGMFIPVFFVVSGMHLDVRDLFSSWSTAGRIPLFVIALLVVRGIPTWWGARKTHTTRERLALALFAATGLSLIVAITTVGLATKTILPANAAALVGAGMISMLFFPSIGLSLLEKRETKTDGAAPSPTP